MEIKKILVTGANGYLGSILINDLLTKKYNILAIDLNLYPDSLDKNYKTRIKILKKDFRKIEKKALKDVDAIIHLAAISNDPMGEINKKLTKDINFKATLRLAKLAKKNGIKLFIFPSSCSIYGIADNKDVTENQKPQPLTSYAKSKLLAEKELEKLADKSFFVYILRFATLYGYSPKFRSDLVVNNLTACAIALKKLNVQSDGTPWRPLLDVKDASAILTYLLTNQVKKLNGKPINVGFTKNNVQVKHIVKAIQSQLPSCKVNYENKISSDKRSYRVNFDKFKNNFPNIKQKWPLKKSVAEIIKNLNDANFNKKDFKSNRFIRLSALQKSVHKLI